MEFLILDHYEGDEPLKQNESIEVDEDQYITLGTDSVEIQAGFEKFRTPNLVSRNFLIFQRLFSWCFYSLNNYETAPNLIQLNQNLTV
jgi:hypothetical protein